MRINLNVLFSEKESAKRLGAKWDGKTWYIIDVEDLSPFMKWIPKHLKERSKGYTYTTDMIITSSFEKKGSAKKMDKKQQISWLKQAKINEMERFIK